MNTNLLNSQIPNHMLKGVSTPRLGLSQVDGFIPPREVVVHGQKWTLVRDSKSPFSAVPNMGQMEWQFGDNMQLNFFDPPMYWYCLHGVKKPSEPGEQPVRMLFQWFHQIRIPLNPTQISEADWQKANVYVCNIGQFESDFCAAMFGAYSQLQQQAAKEWPDVFEAKLKLGQSNVESTEVVNNEE